MSVKTQHPVTVLYRGDLHDTATIVGLVQSNIRIGVIAYTGSLGKKNLENIKSLNRWLEQKSQPLVSIHPHLTLQQLEQVIVNPLSGWGWGPDECKTAINLSGIKFIQNNEF